MKYLLIGLLGMISLNAQARDCYCKFQTGTTYGSTGILVKDWGVISNPSSGIGSNSAEAKCKNDCSAKGSLYMYNGSNAGTIQGWACSAGVASGQKVYAISKVGLIATGGIDQTMGKVLRNPAVYNCPQGGSLNGTSCVITQPVTLSCPNGYWTEASIGKCVKQACPPNSMPGSPNWAAIGAGAIGGINGEYKTDDQDGSRFFINITRSCNQGFNLVLNNCVKTYRANLVSAATCTFVAP